MPAAPLRVLVTGASRGIGASVARRFARAGAHVALLARSHTRPAHSGLRGTLAAVAEEVDALGGYAYTARLDLRDDPSLVQQTVRRTIHALGGLDVLVNNASVLDVSPHPKASRLSLAMDANAKGTLAVSLECLSALRESGGSMVTLSPPIDLSHPQWIAAHPHYTISKYAMTLATLGFATDDRIRANCVWPRHTVATAATQRLEASGTLPHAHSRGRDPERLADNLYALARSQVSGHALLDDSIALLLDRPDLALPRTDAPLDAFVAEGVAARKAGKKT